MQLSYRFPVDPSHLGVDLVDGWPDWRQEAEGGPTVGETKGGGEQATPLHDQQPGQHSSEKKQSPENPPSRAGRNAGIINDDEHSDCDESYQPDCLCELGYDDGSDQRCHLRLSLQHAHPDETPHPGSPSGSNS